MERNIDLTIRVNEDGFEIAVYEPESGECSQKSFSFSPDEHPEFDEFIGNEIYSWLGLWADTYRKEMTGNEEAHS